MKNNFRKLIVLVVILTMVIPLSVSAKSDNSFAKLPVVPTTFTILHTNDFHGQLEPSGSNPGVARVATVVNDVRTAVGAGKCACWWMPAMRCRARCSPTCRRARPSSRPSTRWVIDVATFGNHEFDWGQAEPERPHDPGHLPLRLRQYRGQ